jgi:hypothetical protein
MMSEVYACNIAGCLDEIWIRVKKNIASWDKINLELKAKLEFLG